LTLCECQRTWHARTDAKVCRSVDADPLSQQSQPPGVAVFLAGAVSRGNKPVSSTFFRAGWPKFSSLKYSPVSFPQRTQFFMRRLCQGENPRAPASGRHRRTEAASQHCPCAEMHRNLTPDRQVCYRTNRFSGLGALENLGRFP